MDQRQRSDQEQQSSNKSSASSSSSSSTGGKAEQPAAAVKQTSSPKTQTSPATQQVAKISSPQAAGYQDPIQSIANVLNHHHRQRHHLERQKVLLSSASSKARGAKVDNSSGGSTSVRQQQLADQRQAGGRSLLRAADNDDDSSRAANHQRQKNAGDTSRPHQRQSSQRQRELRADQQVAAVFKQQRQPTGQAQFVPKLDQISSSPPSAAAAAAKSSGGARNHNKLAADATIQSGQQVEQGNSYLYAYNDFITSPSPVGQQQQQQQQQVVIKPTTKSNEQQVKTTTTNKQQQRDNSKIARQDHSAAGLAPQVCLLTGETLSPQVASAIGGRRGLEVTTSGHQRSGRRHLLEGEDSLSSKSEGDDDEADALSYILNRHNLLVAQQQQQQQQQSGVNQLQHQNCNLLHLQASPRLANVADVVAAEAACKQDNLNHLRQYLQIEENFNSYKAARRRRPVAAEPEPATTGGSQFIIAASQSAHEQQQQREHQTSKHQQQFLSFQPPPPPTATSGAGHLSRHQSGHQGGANYLSSSSLSSSQSSLDQQQSGALTSHLFHTTPGGQLEGGRSYLQFFSRFAPANLLAAGGGQKMYAANNQQVVGTLAGQPGAYYVTTNSEPSGGGGSDSSHTDTRQQLPPHLHHLHHAHLTGGGGGHAHHLGGHHHAHNAHHLQHAHHQHQHQHRHLQPHHATITTSSDSSLGSSGPFASSAIVGRTTGWLRDFCSKKCLFISCLMLILFIFILVISLSAYLNFLITTNRTNLQPLSGRMRVNAELLVQGEPPTPPASGGDMFEVRNQLNNMTQQQQQQQMLTRLVGNKTSSEFLQKQRDFETILRGALDRTQPTLKSYPNHLVKLEVYAFKPTGVSAASVQPVAQQPPLWVYFRLFINKRTLQQDGQLMRRRAPDEQLEGQFLPRLTQQTLLNGFEQLMSTFGGGGQPQFGNRLVLAPAATTESSGEPNDELAAAATAAQTLGVNSRRFGQQTPGESSAGRRSSRAIAAPAGSARPAGAHSQRSSQTPKSQQLKSFDEQISKLMHLIEAIDLQSIFVTPDFDLSATQAAAAAGDANLGIMSDTLRASPSLVPATTTTTQPTTTTTFNFKPTTGSRPSSVTPASATSSDARDNGKLSTSGTSTTATSVKHSDDAPPSTAGTTRKFTLAQSYRENSTRPPGAAVPAGIATTTLRPTLTTTTTTTKDSLFLLKHQQKPTKQPAGPIVRVHSGKPLENQAGESTSEKQAAQARQAQEVAQKLKDGASLFGTNGRLVNSISSTASPPARGATAGTPSSTPVTVEELWQSAFSKSDSAGPAGEPSNGPRRLITVTTIGGDGGGGGQHRQQATGGQHQQPSDWQKVGALSAEVSNTIRAQLINSAAANATAAEPTSTLTPVASSSARPPKVSPHLNVGGNNGQPAKPARNQHQPSSAVVLNRDFSTSTTTTTTTPASTANSTAAANARASQPQQPQTHKKKQKNGQQRASASNSLANDAAAAAAGTLRPTRNSTAAGQPPQPKKPAKVKKVSPSSGAQIPSAPNDNLPSDRQSRNQTTRESGAGPSESASSDVASSTVESQLSQANAANRSTTGVSKGIRIVDNFLASIGSPSNGSSSGSARQPVKLTQPALEQFAPTTTTIELTRGTTAQPPPPASRTSPMASVGEQAHKPPPIASGNQNSFVLASQQARPGTTSFSGQWRPLSSGAAGSNATDFWAINTTAAAQSGRASQRKPTSGNLSLIVASERIPASLGQAVTGSQSPFAMPNSALVMQQPAAAAPFSNRFRAPPSPRTTTPSNDFESHRVSRMRQSASHSHRSSDQADPFGSSSSSSLMSSTSGSSSSTTTVSSLSTSSSTTTTSSSLMDAQPPPVASSVPPPPPNTRIVDDFMITTDRTSDGPGGRATTLIPPLVLSGLHKPASQGLQPPPISLVIAQGPKRTRGPFAFETLRSFASDPSEPSETSSVATSTGSDARTAAATADPTPPSEPFDVSSSFEDAPPVAGEPALERPERSSSQSLGQNHQQQVLTDEKLLLRKHLFLVDSSPPPPDGPSDLSFAPSTNSPIATAAPPSTLPGDFADFGDQQDDDDDRDAAANLERSQSGRFGKRRLTTASSRSGRDLKTERAGVVCPPANPFGCPARDTGEFTCLSASQVCDDFTDCQDESDELECVSLQRPEPQTNKLAASNGAGIIYLNRRGALAPMCVDTTSTHDDGDSFPRATNTTSSERHDELIRQINTIGQYACSLQSFARLVSVKINHHDLVDGSKQIRDSKLFHRLAIVPSQSASSPTSGDDDDQQNRISSRSPSRKFQVEISSSSECPSQRTVFIKCGSFECGQDSLKLASPGRRPPLSSAAERAKVLMRQQGGSSSAPSNETKPLEEDSPWLVKLYHNDALACHGYLIDESWLVAMGECFQSTAAANETSNQVGDDWHAREPSFGRHNTSTGGAGELATTSRLVVGAGEWTAEISHEPGRAKRRRVNEVLMQQVGRGDELTSQQERRQFSPIVLAKIERPVRFSLLNRPICLPRQTSSAASGNSRASETINQTPDYRTCLTTRLVAPWAGLNLAAADGSTPTRGQDLVLNKVQQLTRVEDCFEDAGELAGERNLICATSEADDESSPPPPPPGGDDEQHSKTTTTTARVLICSQQPPTSSTRTRSSWVVVGVEHKTKRAYKRARRGARLFASVSGQIDWIVDTMNPKPAKGEATDNDTNQVNPNNSSGNHLARGERSGDARQPSNRARSSDADHQLNGLNPPLAQQPPFLFNNNQQQQQQQTCNRFRCSSGECLSWSRICDGLYDCSSHDDEMDCHK